MQKDFCHDNSPLLIHAETSEHLVVDSPFLPESHIMWGAVNHIRNVVMKNYVYHNF